MVLRSLLVSVFNPYIQVMNADDTANLIYLGLLGGALSLSYIVASRTNLGKTLQHAGIWILIFMGAIAVIGIWPEIKNTLTPQQSYVNDTTIVLPKRGDGHYYITLQVNDKPIEFLIDTGATQVVLSRKDAITAGLDPSKLAYLGTANTANGTVRTAAVRLDTVTLGAITDQDVRAVVNDGEMDGSLLGMTYLGRFKSITIKDNELILTR